MNIVIFGAQIAQGTELGKIAESYISKGQLIPDELMIDILDDVLAAHPESAKGVVFDGFPRTIHQAETLDALLAKRNGQVDIVVGLEVEEEELIVRLINRGKTSGRSDDNLETIKKRLDVYNSQTNVLRDHYMAQGKYEAVHGMGSIEDIFATIKTLVEKHRR